MTFDLVIFDCDGVLVDSEVISCRAHAEALTRARLSDHRRPGARALSRPSRDREARLRSKPSSAARCRTISKSQSSRPTLAAFAGDLQAIPAFAEALAAIEQPICVASSGTPEQIRNSLTCAGLYDRLAPHIFSATQVAHGKPAPDLFLFAAAQMERAPAALRGDRGQRRPASPARVAAGMTVLGFHGGSHCRPGPCASAARRRARP